MATGQENQAILLWILYVVHAIIFICVLLFHKYFLPAISRVKRDLAPAHYTLEIKSYSQLSKAEGDKYESGVFSAAEYNWRLILYPDGNQKSNGIGYISLYLAIDDSNCFPDNVWWVSVNFKFFVHDQKKNQYLAIQYANGAERCFHKDKKQWGIDQLLPLKAFKEPFYGYLVNDNCLFGAEIFVIKPTGTGEALSIFNEPTAAKVHQWRFPNFSKLKDECCSVTFQVGETYWKIVICPNGDTGDDKAKGYLSFYISLQDSKDVFQSKRKLYAKYKMRVLDHPRIKIEEQKSSCWFSSEIQESGYPCFMSLDELNNSGAYLVNDTLLVEVEFLVLSKVKEDKKDKK